MNLERIAKVKRSKPFTALDAIVAAILVAATVAACVLIFRKPAMRLEISDGGALTVIELDGAAQVVALEHLTVRIEDGKVWVTDADCPDKLCEHAGAISRAGQQIVCLPNAIVITLTGDGGLHGVLG